MKNLVYLLMFLLLNMPPVLSKTFISEAMDSWIGYHINDVINVWGYPTEEKTIANRHIFIWEKSYACQIPVNYNTNYYYNTASTYAIGGQTISYQYIRTFEVDKNNKIIQWTCEGNWQPKNYAKGKALVNPANDKWAQAILAKKQAKQQEKIAKEQAKQEKRKSKEGKDSKV